MVESMAELSIEVVEFAERSGHEEILTEEILPDVSDRMYRNGRSTLPFVFAR